MLTLQWRGGPATTSAHRSRPPSQVSHPLVFSLCPMKFQKARVNFHQLRRHPLVHGRILRERLQMPLQVPGHAAGQAREHGRLTVWYTVKRGPRPPADKAAQERLAQWHIRQRLCPQRSSRLRLLHATQRKRRRGAKPKLQQSQNDHRTEQSTQQHRLHIQHVCLYVCII